MHDPISVSIEEVDDLTETVAQLEREKENLKHNLYDVSYERNKLKFDLEKRENQLYESVEKVIFERGKRQRALRGLFSLEVNLESLN